MVLQILADARKVMRRRHAGGLQFLCGPDAGQQQLLRAAYRTRRHHDLARCVRAHQASVLKILDADRSALLDHDAGHEDAGTKRQVGTVEGGAQIGLAAAEALAVLDDEFEEASTFLLESVEGEIVLLEHRAFS